MAILTRPIFHSQERIDLEDLQQLQSGLRTDSKLWVRQLYTDKNFIVKGFDATGIGTDSITVNLLDATLLFAGRRDLTGVTNIGVDAASVADDTVLISNSDGVNFTLTAVASGGPTSSTFNVGSDAAAQATNLAAAITLLDNLTAVANGTTITVTANRTGFTTITASNTGSFNSSGSIIGTFDYTTSVISSPADLSYFILQSGATGAATRLTESITAAQRAVTGQAAKTLYVYGTLTTVQGTPITKAFWDPSANSGAGAEFNQRVNTAQDTTMVLNIQESPLDQSTDAAATTFFSNVAICEIDVDTSGIILSIRDVRPILFEADDQRPWDRSTPYATINADQTVTNATITVSVNGTVPTANATVFAQGEILDFYPITGTVTASTTTARVTSVSGSGASSVITVDKLTPIGAVGEQEPGLSGIPVGQSIAIGRTSAAVKIIAGVSSNFFRDDKSLGDFRNAISALATEIRNVKGTERWYDDPPASVKDILRFINSTIIGIDPDARYAWNATGTSDGTLSIRRDPLSSTRVVATVASANGLTANQTFVFTNTTSSDNITLTAVSSSPSTNQFLIGVDAEATASHLSAAINAAVQPSATTVRPFSATFAQNGSNFDITIGSNVATYTTVTSNLTNVSVSPSAFVYSTVGNLANLKVYGVDADFFFDTINLTIGVDEVLFVTLPDLSAASVASQTFNQTQFRYSQSGPSPSQGGSALWNSTNRALFEDSTDRFKTVPVNDFVCSDRNYWVAYRDASETIFVRDIGELGNNEAANIGQGISNATLAYIGAPSDTDSTPDYPTVDVINAFPPTNTEGAYLTNTSNTFNDFNRTLVAQSENLTSAINDLNNHLTTVKDVQYQNLGLKLIDGGFWTWNSTTGNITTTATAMVQVPGLADNKNTISIIGTAAAFNGLIDGDILYVNINRQGLTNITADQLITPIKANVDTGFTPTRDSVVIARRVGDFLFAGVNGTIRLADGQSAPLDSALQFLGLTGNQLPRQLNTHLQTTGTINNRAVDIGNGDAVFPVGGLGTSGTFDDDVQLTIPINSGILFWEGATFDVNGGRVYNESTTVNWRARSLADTSFTAASTLFTPGGTNENGEVYYAISLNGETTITDTDAELSELVTRAAAVTPAITPVIGRKKGEFDIAIGSPASAKTGTTNRAIPPDFGGSLPIALIRVTASAGVVDAFDADTLTVLGSAGGGGGSGSGDANQDLNNFINRLNLSTFEYMTPIIPGVSITDNIDGTNTNAALSATGAALIADSTFTTSNLLDQEFNADSLTPVRLEVEAYWGQNATNSSIARIDPNAKWRISFNASDAVNAAFTLFTPALSIPVVGFRNNSGTLVGQNLTNSTVNNTIFANKHGLSTGHKINLSTLGGLTPTDPDAGTLATTTQFYIRVISEDSFQLYNTVFNADVADGSTGFVTITGTAISGSTFNRDAGIIDRIGVTDVVRGVFDSRVTSLNTAGGAGSFVPGSAGSVRIQVIGDTDADIRSQSNDADLTGVGLFYKFEGGVDGIDPSSITDVNQLLADNHLGAGLPSPGAENTGISRAVAGRGILLKDTSTNEPLREIAMINGVLSVTNDAGTFVAIAARDAEGNLLVP